VQPGRNARRERREIGAHVRVGQTTQRGEVVIRVHRQFDLGDVVAALRIGHERFGSGRRPLHGPAQFLRGERDERFLGVVIDLRSKPAAHIRRDDAKLVFRDPENECSHQKPDDVRILGGCVEGVLVVRTVVVADGAARLHRVRDEAVVHQFERRDMRRITDRLVHRGLVLGHELPIVAQIVRRFVVDRRSAVERVTHVDDRRQFLDLDLDELRRVARLRQSGRHDDCDRVADMTNLALRKYRMLRLLHRLAVLVGDLPPARHAADALEVLRGEYMRHAGRAARCGGVYRNNPAMSDIRANEMRVKLPWTIDIVSIPATAGILTISTLRRGADAFHLRHAFPLSVLIRRRSSRRAASPQRQGSLLLCCGNPCSDRCCPPATRAPRTPSGSRSAAAGPKRT
jgi:hypothetical protein